MEKRPLSLTRPQTYQIKVPGHLEKNMSDWIEEMDLSTDCDAGDLPITILTGTIDQAALLGLLRHLYSLGLPLISVNYLKDR